MNTLRDTSVIVTKLPLQVTVRIPSGGTYRSLISPKICGEEIRNAPALEWSKLPEESRKDGVWHEAQKGAFTIRICKHSLHFWVDRVFNVTGTRDNKVRLIFLELPKEASISAVKCLAEVLLARFYG